MKKNVVIEEEDDASNFDEYLADFEQKKKDAQENVITELKMQELEKKELEEEIKNLIR